jgi:NDP-sugar pyrophosphorylase family protein
LADVIEGELGSGAHLGLEIIYRRQERADGTARALLLAEPLIEGEAFGVSWGDILVPQAFCPELVDVFRLRRCAAQLAVNGSTIHGRGGGLRRRGGASCASRRSPRAAPRPRAGTTGLLMLTPAVFDTLGASRRLRVASTAAAGDRADGGDGCDVWAVPVRGPWSDVGTPTTAAAQHPAAGGGP